MLKNILQKIKNKLAGNADAYRLTVRDEVTGETVTHKFRTLLECQIAVRELERTSFYKQGAFSIAVSTVEGEKKAEFEARGGLDV